MKGPVLLRKHLTLAGLNQAAFAAQAGISEASISHYLRGLAVPSGPHALLIQSATAGAVPFAAWFRAPKRRPAA